MLTPKCDIDEQKFLDATELLCGYFPIPRVRKDHQRVSRVFLQGKDICFIAHTGYVRSLVFQALPISSDLQRQLVSAQFFSISIGCPYAGPSQIPK